MDSAAVWVPGPQTPVQLSAFDDLCGKTWDIYGLWVSTTTSIRSHCSWGWLMSLARSPHCVCGRSSPQGRCVAASDDGVPFFVQQRMDLTRADVGDSVAEELIHRGGTASSRWSGKHPLMSVTLTKLDSGATALGVMMSHGW